MSTRRLWLAAALPGALAGATARGVSPAAERLRTRFLAPCCWRESLAVHSSPVADDLRAEIDRLLAAGRSEEEITAALLARYGERILREPRGPKAVWLTALPVVAGAFGVAGLGALLWVWRRRAGAAPASWEGPLPELPAEFQGDLR